MTKVLITGAGGFLGEEIVNFFCKKKYFVLATVHNTKKKFKNKIRKKKLDLTKPLDIDFNPEVIVHCASKMPTKGHSGIKMFNDNIKMMNSILNFAQKKNVKYIFNMSSMSVYGNINKSSVGENLKIQNANLYGKSKFENERLLENFVKKNNIIGISLRLPGVVGLLSHSNFLSKVVEDLKKNNDIFAYNKYCKFNNIILAVDIAQFIEKTIKKNFYKRKYFSLNIASNYPIKLFNVLKLLKKKLKSKSKVYWSCSNKKSFTINFKNIKNIGFKPRTTTNSILKLCKYHIKD